MKISFIALSMLVLVFVVIQMYAMSSRKGIESYPYEVVKTYKKFEVRKYEASLFTLVKLKSSVYKNASSEGFRVLAGYIFGGNDKEKKIAMTSPVAMSLDDTMTMMFMVPRNLKKDDMPTPNDGDIKFEEVPAKKVAAITFSGWASDVRIEKYKKRLTQALEKEGIAYSNKFYFFGYNPPYDMVNRRNEVIVELE